MRLLIGEDNTDVLQATRSLLTPEYEVVAEVDDGLKLIAAAQRLRPDIVITDISMPELNGIEACRRILKLGCCKTIIILSAATHPEIVKTAFEAGITGYVLKESAGEELLSAINAALRGSSFISPGIQRDPI